MPASALPPYFTLKLGAAGAEEEITPELQEHLTRIEVSESVSSLDAITIEFSVPMTADRYTLLKSSNIQPGSFYSFKCGSGSLSSKTYEGIIMTMSHDLGRGATWKITLTGVDKMNMLRSATLPSAEGKPFKEFLKDCASEMKADGLELINWKPPEDIPLFQQGKPYLEFLTEIAKKYGFEHRLVDGKLKVFPAGTSDGSSDNAVSWDEDVVSMNLTADISSVYTKSTVVTYDAVAVEDVKAEADGSALLNISGGKTGADYCKNAYERLLFKPNQVNKTPSEIQEEAEQKLQEAAMGFVKGKLSLYGRPDVVAGAYITVSGGFWPLSGRFFVEQVTHTIAPGAGFKTSVSFISDSLPEGP